MDGATLFIKKMNTIFFITSAPIQSTIGNMDIYDSYDAVSRGSAVAPLISQASMIIKKHDFPFDPLSIKNIFTAEKGQTLATAHRLVNVGITPAAKISCSPYLNGVCFSMDDLMAKRKFINLPYEIAIKEARQRFIEKLFYNELIEDFASAQNRIENLLIYLRDFDGNSLCISHSFYMKLVEIYIKTPDAFSSLGKLYDAFQPDRKPYGSLEGFDYVREETI